MEEQIIYRTNRVKLNEVEKFIFIGQKVPTQCVIVRPEPSGWRGPGVAQVGEVTTSLPKEVRFVVSEEILEEARLLYLYLICLTCIDQTQLRANNTDKTVQRSPLCKKTDHLVWFNPDNLLVFPAAGSTQLPDVTAD